MQGRGVWTVHVQRRRGQGKGGPCVRKGEARPEEAGPGEEGTSVAKPVCRDTHGLSGDTAWNNIPLL
jgi:hypothetical protein